MKTDKLILKIYADITLIIFIAKGILFKKATKTNHGNKNRVLIDNTRQKL